MFTSQMWLLRCSGPLSDVRRITFWLKPFLLKASSPRPAFGGWRGAPRWAHWRGLRGGRRRAAQFRTVSSFFSRLASSSSLAFVLTSPAMTWRVVAGRRQQRGGDPAVRQLAEELRAALLPRPRDNARRPEWGCAACGTSNWMDRQRCRNCGVWAAAQTAKINEKRSQSTTEPPTVTPRAPRPWPASRQAPRLGEVAEAAAAAGASPEAVEALRQDAEARRTERRTAGGRLDAARAKVARSSRVAEEAQEAADAADKRAQEAKKAARDAERELAEVEAAVAAHVAGPVADGGIIKEIWELLSVLEQSPLWGPSGPWPSIPEAGLTAIAALRKRLDAEPDAGKLDEALEPIGKADELIVQTGTQVSVPDSDVGADELMDELDSADEGDEATMLAIARRLKRARGS